MAELIITDRMHKKILPDFQEFLLSRRLVQEKHLSCYAHWVSKFLFFSNKNQNLTDELKIEAFMNELKNQDKINDWQVRVFICGVFISKRRLTCMYDLAILICMRTTLNIDDKILERASRITGVKEKTSLVRLGLEALIARESGRRLAELGGTEKRLRPAPRRRA